MSKQVGSRVLILFCVAMVAFCDGSTRALSSSTNYYVYQSLMTLRNDRSDMPTHRYVLKADDFAQ